MAYGPVYLPRRHRSRSAAQANSGRLDVLQITTAVRVQAGWVIRAAPAGGANGGLIGRRASRLFPR